MRLLVTGASGFVGHALCKTLIQHGHSIVALTRRSSAFSASPGQEEWIGWDDAAWQKRLSDIDGVVHLAGESIVSHRWTSAQKNLLYESRILTTRRLVQAIAASPQRPKVMINASAVGYYGPHGNEELTEQAPAGGGFLANLCRNWEAEAQKAQAFGVRVIRLRIGLVLAAGGGVLQKMVPPFRFFLGGPLGHGRQWISWIQRDDLIGMVEWFLTQNHESCAVNATSPNPVTMRQFCQHIGRKLHRPSSFPVPAVVLRLLLGEMSDMLLTGQRVIPQVAKQRGYRFIYPTIDAALEACELR